MAFDVAGGDSAFSASAEQAVGPYLRAVRRHWRVVALVTLIAAAVAGLTIERSGKTYEASGSILVTPLPQGTSSYSGIGTVLDTSDPARTVQTAAALIDTPDTAASAARQLGQGWSTNRVQDAVSVTPRGQSNVLAITAQAPSPSDAARVANAFATSAIALRAGIVQNHIADEIASLQSRLASLPAKSSASSA